MTDILKNKSMFFIYLLGLIQIIVCILGLINYYSPIPFWDMWSGYLDFYAHILNGEYKYIFLQHNEHRIVLSKILFIIDISLFKGKSYFLLTINIILMLLIAYQFFKFIDRLFINYSRNEKHLLKIFVMIILFSWTQYENITWGFQSQFYLAYLLPLFSFYLIALYKTTNDSKYFYYSCFFAFLSSYTMANGLLALFMMIVIAFLFKLDRVRILFLIIVTFLNNLIFFYGYQNHKNEGVLKSFLESPLDLFMYAFTYLGSPFFYLFKHNFTIAKIFGFIFIIGILFLTIKFLKKILSNNFLTVFFMQLIYILITCLMTTIGRFSFGIDQAISSRYTTPVLMAWSIFIIIFFYIYKDKVFLNKIKYMFILFISFIFVNFQFVSLKDQSEMKLERELGSLSLSMNIKDTKAIQRVCPSPDVCLENAKTATKYKISIFDSEMYGRLFSSLNKELQKIDLIKSYGYVDNVKEVATNAFKVNGWFFDNKDTCDKLVILNEDNYIIGYAIHGYLKEDVLELYGKKSLNSGFVGYFKSNKNIENLKIQCLNNNTFINAKIKIEPKEILFQEYQYNKVFNENSLEQYNIFGSYINGDIDFAKSKIKYDDSLLYKTGPKSEFQKVLVYYKNELKETIILETSEKWKKLNINVSDYDKNDVYLIFVDESDNWGEWSAYAIKKETK